MESDPFWDHVWEQWAADAAGDRSLPAQRAVSGPGTGTK